MIASIYKKYAKLIVKIGANVAKGDEILINSSIEGAPLAAQVAEQCYQSGAKRVQVMYGDNAISRIKFLREDIDTLTDIPKWLAEAKNSCAGKHCAVIQILSEDPNLYEGVAPEKITAYSKAAHKAFAAYYDNAMSNRVRWTLCAVPCEAWAKQVFPELGAKKGIKKLWELIIKTMRLDKRNSVAAWKEHQQNLLSKIDFMNNAGFTALHYKNGLGTDFTVGLPDGYIFSGAREKSVYGRPFCANMPTEEIFSLPHKLKADGKVVASMPLVYNGTIIENFSFTFKDGLITDFSAEKGYEVLKGILDTDEGSRRLGEVALVQYDSPIQNLKTLFFNTLFDENASCHLAIGRAYPLITGAEKMSAEELAERGVNFSGVHVDFMIGTPDLSITGIKRNGEEIPVFANGNFAI